MYLNNADAHILSLGFLRYNLGNLSHDYLIKYEYFDKMLFRKVCFYQWSRKLNYKFSLMVLAIWDILEAQAQVTDDWELTVEIFTLKWAKDNERTTSSFRYISEAIKRFLNIRLVCVFTLYRNL